MAARRFRASGLVIAEPLAVCASTEMLMPACLAGHLTVTCNGTDDRTRTADPGEAGARSVGPS